MRRRTFLISGFALVVGIALGVSAAAWLFRDHLGRRAADRLTDEVRRRSGWTLAVGGASFTGPLSLRLSEVRARHPSGALEVRVAAVEASMSRSALLRARVEVRRVTLRSPDVRIGDLAALRTVGESGGSAGSGVRGPQGGASGRSLPRIVVEGGSLVTEGGGQFIKRARAGELLR